MSVTDLVLEQRMADAKAWMAEFLDPPEQAQAQALDQESGRVRIALAKDGDWNELRGFRATEEPFAGLVADHAGMLDVLVASLIEHADEGHDVFVCPHLHVGMHRRQGRALVRRHVHCDVDGPLNLRLAADLGAMAVASGGLADNGEPRGHVYVRLSEPVTEHEHRILCAGLGWEIGGDDWDTSKTSDADVLRLAGTLNHKTNPPRPVTWLIGPDDPGVRTWEPQALAQKLGIVWPPQQPQSGPQPPFQPSSGTDEGPGDPVTAEQPPIDPSEYQTLAYRLGGLVRSVENAPTQQGNIRLNWAAGKAAALLINASDADKAAMWERLIAAYVGRTGGRWTKGQRRSRAKATVDSRWGWGTKNPERALRGEAPPAPPRAEEAADTGTGTDTGPDAGTGAGDSQDREQDQAEDHAGGTEDHSSESEAESESEAGAKAGAEDHTGEPPTASSSTGSRLVLVGQNPSVWAPEGVESIWEARPIFRAIRAWARFAEVNPWGLLGAVIAYTICAVPPNVVTGTKSGGSLNLICAEVAEVGGGKGESITTARRAVAVKNGMPFKKQNPGTGEGLLAGYGWWGADPPGTQKRSIRVHDSVLLDAREVTMLTELAKREGATLVGMLLMTYSGETLEFGNKTDRFSVEEGTYRFGMVVGVQPTSKNMLVTPDAVNTGLPQRILWFPAGVRLEDLLDESDDAPVQPAVHEVRLASEVQPPNLSFGAGWSPALTLTGLGPPQVRVEFADEVIRAARKRRRAQVASGHTEEGHREFTRVKLACWAALMDSRTDVRVEDDRLAELIMAVSDATREAMLAAKSRSDAKTSDQRKLAEELAKMKAADRIEAVLDKQVANRVRKVLSAQQGRRMARSALRTGVDDTKSAGRLRREGRAGDGRGGTHRNQRHRTWSRSDLEVIWRAE